jgi:predicted nucleic acid-binding protein
MILYLDTSALVKFYVAETGTEEVIKLLNDAEYVGSAQITYVEMASALSKAVRMQWIKLDEMEKAWGDFLNHWPSFTRITITTGVVERAAQLARQYGLRGYDATHLAAARVWGESLDTQIIVASFDKELLAGARAEGLAVWPE